uniref:PLAT domain-containing protein n=1 Tax=Strigamia maritima TaxID=126957 RepID=T1ITA5_STRMM
MVSVIRYRGYGIHRATRARTPSPERNHIRQLEPPKRRPHIDLSSIVLETDIPGPEPDPAMVQYEIRVATGDIYGAGTDANVYISVFGTSGESGKLQLTKKYTNLFERGRTDCFIMDLPDDLGELTKLRIEHDDSGFGAAWLLDCVHVTNLKTLVSNVFLCNEWLDNEHGTLRDLTPLQIGSFEDDPNTVQYEVRVATGDTFGAGTDANVYILLFGTTGDSGIIQLTTKYTNLFERGKTDCFIVDLPADLGELTKLRIEHDDSGFGAAWLLDSVFITNLKTEVAHVFICNEWLDNEHGRSRDLRAIPEDSYDDDDTGLSSLNWICCLYSIDDWRNPCVINSINLLMYRPRSAYYARPTKLFHVPKVDMNDFFQPQILAASKTNVNRHQFKSSACDLPHLSRKKVFLNENGSARIDYELTVRTGHQELAGTTANVYMKLIGKYGTVPKQRLKTMCFPPGSVRICKIHGPEIGDLKCVLVESDAFDEKDCWFLVDILIHNCNTNQTWHIPCHSWLSLWRGDGRVSKFFPAKSYQSPHFTEVNSIDYEITTVTGTIAMAGCSANIFVTVYGEKFVSPKIHLVCNDGDCFRRGKKDSFFVRGPNVGYLKQIKIEHDNSGNSPSWYLEKVIITDLEKSKMYTFSCNNWLAADKGDTSITRYLRLSNETAENDVENYRIDVLTGSQLGAETDSKVYISLFGQYGESGEHILENGINSFQQGSLSQFFLTTPSLGTIRRIKIRHDNNGLVNPSWFLEKVSIENMKTNTIYDFHCHRWLCETRGDGKIERHLVLHSTEFCESTLPVYLYTVKISTGEMTNAGTTASVFIILYGGIDGQESSGKIWLTRGKFKRGCSDVFDVELPALLSPLSRLAVGHDNIGTSPSWYLVSVAISCLDTGIEQFFPCRQWLARSQGDRAICRELYEDIKLQRSRKKLIPWMVTIYTGCKIGSGTDSDVHLILYGNKGKSNQLNLWNLGKNFHLGATDQFQLATNDIGIPTKIRIWVNDDNIVSGWYLEKVEFCNKLTMQTYIFYSNRWLSKTEDDGRILREFPAEGPGIHNPFPIVQYSTMVYTGSECNAGSTANVSICIYGDLGDSGERVLQSANEGSKFEKDQVDEFSLEAVYLGNLYQVTIKHGTLRSGEEWYLEKIIIWPSDKEPQTKTIFLCNSWINNEEKDLFPLKT